MKSKNFKIFSEEASNRLKEIIRRRNITLTQIYLNTEIDKAMIARLFLTKHMKQMFLLFSYLNVDLSDFFKDL